MQPAEFKINFKLSNTVHYAVGPSGVYTSGTPYDVLHLPEGWKDLELATDREAEGWGLMTETSTTFKFTLDGAAILRYIAYREGASGRCTIDIYKRGHTNYDYSLIYTGDVDFRTFDDQDEYVSVNIDQAGVAETIVRDQDKTFEITLDAADSIPIALDGVAVRNNTMLRMQALTGQNNRGQAMRPQINAVKSESDIGISTINNEAPELGSVNYLTNKFFFSAKVDGQVSFVYDFGIYVHDPNQLPVPAIFSVILGLTRANNTTYFYALYSKTWQSGQSIDNINIAGSLNINVGSGDKLSILCGWLNVSNGGANLNGPGSGNGTNDVTMEWNRGIVQLGYNTRQDVTLNRAYRYGQMLRKFIAKLTDGAATLAPNVFDDPNAVLQDLRPYHLTIMPAEVVRGITNANYKLKFTDFVKDLSRMGLAFSVLGNTVSLQRKDAYFQNTPITGGDLGAVDNVEITQALPYLFSGVKVGAKAGDNDALQGRYEINAPMEYKITPSKSDSDIDLTSPFVSGMYAIEQIRSQRLDATTNRPDDNRIILLEVDATPVFGYYFPYRPQNASGSIISGLIDAAAGNTAFNLTLSPARDLIRSKPQLSVQFVPPLLLKVMTFLSAEREGDMLSRFGASGQLIKERAGATGINFLSADPPFLPYLVRFVAPEPLSLYSALQTNPYGYLTFNYKGVAYKGFIHELIRHPGNNAQMECQLLLHPSTDLSTLY